MLGQFSEEQSFTEGVLCTWNCTRCIICAITLTLAAIPRLAGASIPIFTGEEAEGWRGKLSFQIPMAFSL